MKKYLLSFAVLMMGAFLFTACSDDDDDDRQPVAVDVSEGMFIVGSGNTRSNIDGNLRWRKGSNFKLQDNGFKKPVSNLQLLPRRLPPMQMV